MVDRFICRASAVKSIMTNPRSKADREAGILSDTAKGVVIKKAVKDIFGFESFFRNKYTDKGIELEDMAIEAVGNYYFADLKKNTERLTNDWVTGECDILTDDYIRDTKCSWSVDTFPWTDEMLEKAVKSGGYDWQGQVYMWLWDRPVHYVDFVLLPTPEECLKHDDDPHEHIELVKAMPIEKRIRTYKIERDDSAIEAVKEAVEKCQPFYQELVARFRA